jgi:hypothetical protein
VGGNSIIQSDSERTKLITPQWVNERMCQSANEARALLWIKECEQRKHADSIQSKNYQKKYS